MTQNFTSTLNRVGFVAVAEVVVTGVFLGVAVTLGAAGVVLALSLVPAVIANWWFDTPSATATEPYSGVERRA